MTRYGIVPERSEVWINATSSVHPIHAHSEGLQGYLELDLNDSGAVDLSTPPRARLTMELERLRAGNRLEDLEMRRRLDTRRFPTIDGELVEMADIAGDGRYRVDGDITFRGVTRRCSDEMVVTVEDDSTIMLAGESIFDIRDFGMEPPRILMMRVHPEVGVRVEIVARSGD